MSNKNEVIVKRPKAMVLDYNTFKNAIFSINKDNIDLIDSNTLGLKYTKEQILDFLKNPTKNEKKIREISNFLYITNSYYKNIINLYRDVLLFYYKISFSDKQNIKEIDKESLQKEYNELLSYFDIMNISHEMKKILNNALIDDVFYGYEYRSDNSYYIQKLNPDYCRISTIEDGVYNFKFDFSIFDKDKNKKEGEKLIDSYAPEFKAKYNILKRDKKKKKKDMWMELDSKNTICIKINENIKEVIPPFVNLFSDIYNIEDYKVLKKSKEEMGGYELLIEQIPINDKSDKINDYLVDPEEALKYHQLADEMLPSQVGLMISPLKITPIQFKQDTVDIDNVGKATRDFYNNAGMSQLLFNSENAGTIGLNRNIEVIESYMFAILRQIERWFNRKIKFLNLKYNYNFQFFDITQFNKEKFRDAKLKAAEYGLPIKQDVCISYGMKQSEIVNSAYVENEILGLNELFIPLQSSHTQSNKEDSGRPQKDESDLSDDGIKTKDTDGNNKKAK